MAATTLQGFIDKNAQITFSNQLLPQTSEYFKGLCKSTLKLVGNLLPDEKRLVEESFPCPVMWQAPKEPIIRPHPILAVMRDGMRTVFKGLLDKSKGLKTLYVGSTYREIRNLATDVNSHFSIYGTEPKDTNRVFTGMQDRIGHLFAEVKNKYPEFEGLDFEFALTERELVELYASVEGLRDRIGWQKERSGEAFARLIYEDSHYNKTREDFYQDFKNTGANVGYVLGMLPPELLEQKGPQNAHYKVQQTKLNGTRLARMTDVRGYANGYTHDWDAWATLMRYPAYSGKDFNLVFEMVSRVGPFAIIEICRTRNAGVVTRDLTLYSEPYVKVVNLGYYADKPRTMAELVLKKVVDFDQYFVMSKREYDSVYDYVSSLAEASINLTAVVSFIRKRSGGAALIDKVFTRKWDLESQHYSLLAAVVILRVARDRDMLEDAKGTLRHEGVMKRLWRGMLSFHIPEWFVDLCTSTDILQNAVKLFDPVFEQTVVLDDKAKKGPSTFLISGPAARGEIISAEVGEPCKMCSLFPHLRKESKADLQRMECGRDIESHTWQMSDSEVEEFRATMVPDDTDAPALVEIKKLAKAQIPRTGFSVTTKAVHLAGAFGTGKSFQIKALVTKEDVVLAPFKKLMSDYETDKNGDKIYFKTMHRAIADHRQCRYMFIDEVGSMPAEYIQVCAYLYQPEIIFLVGDMKQTKTMAAEGTCIDKVFDCTKAHYLVKNFRNSYDTIKWAVEKQGYNMEPAGDEFNSHEPMITYVAEDFVIPDDMPHISPDRGLVNLGITSHTVRQYQGQTEKELVVSLFPESLGTFSVPCIKLVALTRAKGTTYIRCCSDVSVEAIKGVIGAVDHQVYRPKPKREDEKQKHGRFMTEIMRFMSRKQQERLLTVVAEDVKAYVRQKKRDEADAVLDSNAKTFEDVLGEADAEEIAALDEEERVAFMNADDDDTSRSVTDESEMPLNTDVDESVDVEPEVPDIAADAFGSDDMHDADEDARKLIAEINAIAERADADWWREAPIEERWAEVDREVALGRPFNANVIAFITTHTRVTFTLPELQVGSSFAIGDADDFFDSEDEKANEEDEDDEKAAVLDFI